MNNKESAKKKPTISSVYILVVAGILSLFVVTMVMLWSKAIVGETSDVVTYTEGLHQVERGEEASDPLVTVVSAAPKILDSDPILGSDQAKVTIINFSDFLCTHCATTEDTLQDLLKLYPEEVRLVWKDAPVDIKGGSYQAALAARCAQDQGKFWEMHDLMLNNQISLSTRVYSQLAGEIGLDLNKFNNCLSEEKTSSYVDQAVSQAEELGITQIPYLFIGDMEFVGLGTLEDFQVVVEYLLNEADQG